MNLDSPNTLRVFAFSVRAFEMPFLTAEAARQGVTLVTSPHRLEALTAPLAAGFPAVSAFVNDSLDEAALKILANLGVRLVALRCAGYNNVDLAAAARLGVRIARVPAYSPHAVSEHALALLLTLLRKTHKAYNRVREGNFALEGLLGSEVHGKTAGLLGTGRIGAALAEALIGMGAHVIASDPYPSAELIAKGVEYVSREELFRRSEILSLHCPLTPDTRHVINAAVLAQLRPGAVIINTSRGGLIDAAALLEHLKDGHLGALGLDVYEEEEAVFFGDHSAEPLQDDVLARLLTFPNVLVTGHQGFFTDTALKEIASVTFKNVQALNQPGTGPNELK